MSDKIVTITHHPSIFYVFGVSRFSNNKNPLLLCHFQTTKKAKSDRPKVASIVICPLACRATAVSTNNRRNSGN